ncbi:uncharacterized protein ARMOST_06088 [Armillaria ostoyae]|uniref:Uncharacterized protein n=1 Tax=Armillaria ostoyae TaxID=47428 RepID=A0A284R240_ARMOS|nr:uncharacterized protein ARMOST_06088 [Armillaria ostoyae]
MDKWRTSCKVGLNSAAIETALRITDIYSSSERGTDRRSKSSGRCSHAISMVEHHYKGRIVVRPSKAGWEYWPT